jgi:hypothetical protein
VDLSFPFSPDTKLNVYSGDFDQPDGASAGISGAGEYAMRGVLGIEL